ncbi:hypothetical protein KCV03_g103, partial [Aureobasidium melanogenum]
MTFLFLLTRRRRPASLSSAKRLASASLRSKSSTLTMWFLSLCCSSLIAFSLGGLRGTGGMMNSLTYLPAVSTKKLPFLLPSSTAFSMALALR